MAYRLAYSSHASPTLDAADLEGMLVESRIRNRARGITGVLVFVDGTFLQILEGEKEDVLDLMARIRRDSRHYGLKVFVEEEVAESAFASWSMAYLHPSAAEVARWAQLEAATRIEDVVAGIESNPGSLPVIIINLLRVLATS